MRPRSKLADRRGARPSGVGPELLQGMRRSWRRDPSRASRRQHVGQRLDSFVGQGAAPALPSLRHVSQRQHELDEIGDFLVAQLVRNAVLSLGEQLLDRRKAPVVHVR
jgi:hypothetical protein